MDHRVALAGFPGRVATLLFAVLALALVTPAAAAGAPDDSPGANAPNNSADETKRESLKGAALEFLARRVVYHEVCEALRPGSQAKSYVSTDKTADFNQSLPKTISENDVSQALRLGVRAAQAFTNSKDGVLSKARDLLGKQLVDPIVKMPAGTAKNDAKKLAVRIEWCLRYLDEVIGEVDGWLEEKNKAQETVSTRVQLASGLDKALKPAIKIDGDPLPINEYLVLAHRRYKDLKKWARALEGKLGPQEHAELQEARERVQSRIHDAMSKRGLYQPLAAQLVTGFVLTNGETGDDKVDGTDAENTQANAHVVWSSRYYELSPERWSASFGGKLGIQPAMTLVKPEGNKTTDELSQKYQSAFVWSLSPKISFHPGGHTGRSELSLAGNLGQIRLLEKEVVVKKSGSGKGSLAIPLNSQTEWFYEFGLAYRLFNTSVETIRAEKTQLAPLFELELLLRHDNRFKKTGALVDFDSPERRLIFRFALNGLQVVDKRPDAKTSKPFTLSFGVEHERALGGDTVVPSGTRLFLRGDLNLIKAIRGS